MNEAVENETKTEAPADENSGKIERGQFKKYAERYGAQGHNGDAIATAFASYVKVEGKVSVDRLAEIASANGIDFSKWANVNVGMKRMNLGNALRGIHNKGKPVTIGDQVIEGKTKETVEAAPSSPTEG